MKLKMPKLAYLTILGLFLVAFTFTACNNKKKSDNKSTTDTTAQKPVDGGN